VFESIHSQLQHRIATGGHTEAIDEELAILAQREASLTAADTDDETLRSVADAELADVQNRRLERRQLRDQRYGALRERADLYVQHDATVDAVAAVAADMRTWKQLASYPALTPIAEGLDAIVARSRDQRGRPAAQRTDDLDDDTAAVSDALLRLRGVLADASAQLALATTGVPNGLTAANQKLIDVNGEAPPQ
jgi:hypothetical protein